MTKWLECYVSRRNLRAMPKGPNLFIKRFVLSGGLRSQVSVISSHKTSGDPCDNYYPGEYFWEDSKSFDGILPCKAFDLNKPVIMGHPIEDFTFTDSHF